MCFQYDHSYQELGIRSMSRTRAGVTRALALLLLFASPTLLIGASASSDSDLEVASKIRSLELLRFEALKERNVAALDSLLDEDLMWVNANGTLSTKARYLGRLQDYASSQLKIETMTVKVFEGMATVVGIYNESGVKNNRPYRQRCRFIDTWSFKHDKWVLIAATATATIS